MKLKYINLVIEIFLGFTCAYFFWFGVDSNNIISITNNKGERLINNSTAKLLFVVATGSAAMFANYCLIEDLYDSEDDK